MRVKLFIVFFLIWSGHISAINPKFNLINYSLYNGDYSLADSLIGKINPNISPLTAYQKYTLCAEFNYLTHNLEHFKYYIDSAKIILDKHKSIPRIYLAEVYRNYSKYHHFHAMAFYAVAYADSALLVVHKNIGDVNLIDLHTIYFAKASAERNKNISIVNTYFDSAFLVFKSDPYRMYELYRSYGSYCLDIMSSKNVTPEARLKSYKESINAFNHAEYIVKRNYPKNLAMIGAVYSLKGLATYLAGGEKEIAASYFNTSINCFQKADNLSYTITSYLTALNWQRMVFKDSLNENYLLALNRRLRVLVPSWELWVKNNINPQTHTLKYIYSNSPLNVIAKNYVDLYMLTSKQVYADSFFYYVEAIKGYALYNDMSKHGYHFKPTSIKRVQQNLKSDEAAISYFSDYISSDYAILIQKNKYDIVEIDKKCINYVWNFYHCFNVKFDFDIYRRNAFMVYSYVFKPLQEKLGYGVRKIKISPSNHSGSINFDALVEDSFSSTYKNLSYLFKKYQFSYQVSLSLSEFLQNQKSTKHNAVAFIPSYVNSDVCELPFISNQSEALINYGFDVKRDFFCTVDSYKGIAPNIKYLHIGGHSSVSDNLYSSEYAFLFNRDNGGLLKLTVEDIINTKLDADMVVLALCETGVGDYNSSEATLNIAYYFIRAGAKSCVYGSSKLDDKSTAFILTNFYEFLQQGFAKDEALYKAKLKYWEVNRLDEEFSPIFWSPLIIQGNLNPINLGKPKYGFWDFVLAEFLFVLLLLLGIYKKQITI